MRGGREIVDVALQKVAPGVLAALLLLSAVGVRCSHAWSEGWYGWRKCETTQEEKEPWNYGCSVNVDQEPRLEKHWIFLKHLWRRVEGPRGKRNPSMSDLCKHLEHPAVQAVDYEGAFKDPGEAPAPKRSKGGGDGVRYVYCGAGPANCCSVGISNEHCANEPGWCTQCCPRGFQCSAVCTGIDKKKAECFCN